MLKKLLFLSPKEEAVTSIGSAIEVLDMQKENPLSINIIYYDEKNKKYTEKYLLDLDSYKRCYIDRKDISHVAQSIEEIAKHIKGLRNGMK